MLNIYVTSSERKAGKSFISAGISAVMQSLGYSTSYYKPVQTGCIENNGFIQSQDVTFIKTIDPYINAQFSYLYKTNSDVLIASELENKPLDIDFICNEYKRIASLSDVTIIDGDNSLLSPIAPLTQNADMIRKLAVPVLLVTTPSENSVNNTLMTINTALEKGIPLRGVIINNIMQNCSKTLLTSMPRIIEEYSNAKVLGLVPHIEGDIIPETIISSILNGIDIESIFNIKIEKLDMN